MKKKDTMKMKPSGAVMKEIRIDWVYIDRETKAAYKTVGWLGNLHVVARRVKLSTEVLLVLGGYTKVRSRKIDSELFRYNLDEFSEKFRNLERADVGLKD